ncbi:hypothetical protein MAPG_07760 [Magnaporthiopsis poae ATCC 64411]|uniref:Uncharacterized protein n=1 Tax=Magnaporthiopsis poae (strain ATCC 64411 / 73-15) TaxID=644358 RepID=A0A0C4CSH5_MAGP6|nr:hypothetical protein, variant [Magnaporthiopsis poae ATCC 64411]KLU88777.1 hypothetical protein MAPG_07760 [Magnaporthiopsis poae ATCC 64411]
MYLFFKVFINGRREVAWGIDLEKNRQGSTAQALYSPGKLYEYTDEQGRTMTQPGIEARRFYFLPQNNKATSVASEGGLIEVQVFRAYGRTRRAPNPLPYRSHENYGVALMTEGLLSNPEENRYYSYSLADPSDAPYAAFRFHYRSWANLNDLQIVSQDELEGFGGHLGSTPAEEENIAPRSNRKVSHPWGELEEFGYHLTVEERAQKRKVTTSTAKLATTSRAASSGRSSSVLPGEDDGGVSRKPSSYDGDSIFDDSEDDGPQSLRSSNHVRGGSSTGESYYYLKSPPQLRPPASISGDRIPQPSKAVRDCASLDNLRARPLPDLPVPDLPDGVELKMPISKRQSSVSSGTPSVATSAAASIAPSLLPYVEGDAFTSDFEYTAARRAGLERCKAHEIHVKTRGDSPASRPGKKRTVVSRDGNRDDQAPAGGSWVDGEPDEKAPGSSDYSSSSDRSLPSSDDDCQYPPREFAPSVYYSLSSPKRRFASLPPPSADAWRPSGSVGGDGITGAGAGAGKISPKAKQLLGDELDYSSSFATLAATASSTASTPPTRRPSNGSTLRMSESEWIRSGKVGAAADTLAAAAAAADPLAMPSWSPGLEHRRRPSRGSFLSKLWSPRLRSSNSTANTSQGTTGSDDNGDGKLGAGAGAGRTAAGRDTELDASSSSPSSSTTRRKKVKKRIGSSLAVGLGGYVPPEDTWI